MFGFKRKYYYFVLFMGINSDGKSYGSCSVDRNRKMSSIEDVTAIGDSIKNKYNFNQVIIFNFKLLNWKWFK